MTLSDDAQEVERDRRHERFLIRVTLVALLAIGLFLLVRQVWE